jgi:hypothetical protein
MMDAALVAAVRKSLEPHSTEELRSYYEAHDISEWSPGALESMRQILHERGVTDLSISVPKPQPAPAVVAAPKGWIEVWIAGCFAGAAIGFFMCMLLNRVIFPFIEFMSLIVVGGALWECSYRF